MIAFFGMGLLGSGFVRALRKRGEEVHVWNRTPAKAQVLGGVGAKPFDEPADAARGATHIHLTLSDDAAVDDVLERARPGIGPETIIVDHTTTSAAGVPARALRWKERGVRFLHAPLFMGPSNALEGTGLMLASGDEATFEAVRPRLEAMTGKLRWLGPRPETAAAFKLLGNLHLAFLTTGLADFFSLARAMKVNPADAATLFDSFNPGVTIGARIQRMFDAKWDEPSWELGMARKDVRLMQEEALRAGVKLEILPTIAARMDAVIAQGHAHSDWTVLAKDALGPRR